MADRHPIRFEVTAARTVVSARRRKAAGLHHWVDGTMGILRSGGAITVVAPNGPVLSRHSLAAGSDDLIAGLRCAEEPIVGLPDGVEHAAGGPLFAVPEEDLVVVTYHGETFAGGDHRDYWSFIGLAVSEGEGPFVDMGAIVTSVQREHDPTRPRGVDLGSGASLVRDGWFHVYFQERSVGRIDRHLCVARAPVAEVVDAARARRAPRFTKLSETGWDQPGLGGRAAELMGGSLPVLWHDVAYLEAHARHIVVFATVERLDGDVAWWNHAVSTSCDGRTWDEPVLLLPRPVPFEVLYTTVDGEGPDPRRIEGDRFGVYRVAAPGADRWATARLERLEVTIRT